MKIGQLIFVVACLLGVWALIWFIVISPLDKLQNSLPKVRTFVNNGTTTQEIINSAPVYDSTTTTIINGDTTTTEILQWQVSK